MAGNQWKAGQSGNPKGRVKGIPNKKALDLQAECVRLGITPANVMLRRMAALWKKGTDESKDKAVEIAAMVAPYIHPRLAAQQLVIENRAVIDGKASAPMSSGDWEKMAKEQTTPPSGNGSVH